MNDETNVTVEDVNALDEFTDQELEHFVTTSCMRQKQAEYDLKIMADQFKSLIKTEKERRAKILDHIKSRKDADKIVAGKQMSEMASAS